MLVRMVHAARYPAAQTQAILALVKATQSDIEQVEQDPLSQAETAVASNHLEEAHLFATGALKMHY